jgi:1-acyl-sn-glycerol-3-phosphate acyltransferase
MLVDRSRPDRTRIFAWANRLTEHRLSLFFFPEGTRSRDGRVGRFKTGSFYLALEAGLTIVPLSIVGSRHVMLKGRLAAYPGHVRLIVHEPIGTKGFSGSDRKAFADRVRRIIAPAAESDLDVMPPDTHSDAGRRRGAVAREAQQLAPHQ